MNVLLSHGYFIADDPKEQAIMKPYPPLGILSISAWLEQEGIENTVFDTTFSSKEAFRQHVLEAKPRILALYTNLMTKLNVLESIKFVRSQPTLEKCTIVLGGPDVTYNTDAYLGAGADVVVIGEGEQTMTELVQAVENGSDFSAITGIAYRTANGRVERTATRQKLRSINELPMPNRKAIDLHKYLEVWQTHHGKSAINVSTQRGCPYTCKWCSTAVYGQSYRRRSPEVVVQELKYLRDTYNPGSIWFVDDVFTVSHKWLRAFADELKKQDVCIPYECITRAERMNDEVLALLRESGCFRVWIGAESGSQKIIDAMDRRVDVETVREMIRQTRASGIEAGTFIMLGYPGETEADINETIHHLKTANPDHFTITISYPIKGTALYEEIEADLTVVPDWEQSTDRDLDFKRTYPRKFYEYAVRRVYNEVYYHKKRLQNPVSPKLIAYKLRSFAALAGMRWVKLSGG